MLLNNYHYIPLNYTLALYIDIDTLVSIPWASSTCEVFISLMNVVNGAQFSNITYLSLSYLSLSSSPAAVIVLGPRKSIHASLELQNQFSIIVLNLI